MILYDLQCENDHVFEAWFASSEQYEKQRKKNLICCPICNTTKVKKALMAPKLKGAKKSDDIESKKLLNNNLLTNNLKKFKKYIEENSIDVGKNFTEEARKIYYGETKPKSIRGETTKKQAEDLIEEGIPISRLLWSSKKDA